MSVLLDSFAASLDALPARDAAGLGEARRTALASVLRDGLPHARSEAWRYTPLRTLERRAFAPPAANAPAFDIDVLATIPSPRAVFVNGRFDGGLSDLGNLPAGVSLQPLSRLLANADDAHATNFLARRFDRADEVFARLNAALADDGVVLRADAGATGTLPIHLVFIGAPAAGDQAWHLRHLVELGEDAALQVVEHQFGAGAHNHLANSLMHVHLDTRAQLSHARLQDESPGATVVNRTDAVLAREAVYRRLDLELGGALSRHDFNAELQGESSSLLANGVLLATGKRHLDTRLAVDHSGRDSACAMTWRGLGAGRSRAAFHGGILIREGADGTSAMLSNKNLLLSEGAEIDTQPVLEIHADEVQAAHGATVGQIDPIAMFYLRSRGLPTELARALLTAAFCRETLSVFDDSYMRGILAPQLDAALSRLEGA